MTMKSPMTPDEYDGCDGLALAALVKSQYVTLSALPIGAHFGADLGGEDTLFRLARQLEQAAPCFARRPSLPVGKTQ